MFIKQKRPTTTGAGPEFLAINLVKPDANEDSRK
jgi:hypothetical protein